jgi:hypothetical protein
LRVVECKIPVAVAAPFCIMWPWHRGGKGRGGRERGEDEERRRGRESGYPRGATGYYDSTLGVLWWSVLRVLNDAL